LFADHPLEYASTFLFFVGLASLAARAAELLAEWQMVRRVVQEGWASRVSGTLSSDDIRDTIARWPESLRTSRLGRRVEELVQHLQLCPNGGGVQECLRYLADRDAVAAQGSYALVRMFIWAIPILGFLGTVVGIAMALGRLAPQQLEESLPQVMASLTVAFNTTILALGLCLVLYFALFFVERSEAKLLEAIDTFTEHLATTVASRPVTERSGTKASLPSDDLTSDWARLSKLQLELVVREVSGFLRQVGEDIARLLQASLVDSLARALAVHLDRLAQTESQLLAEYREQTEELHRAFFKRAEQMAELQSSIEQRTELLLKAVESSQVLLALQEVLNRNLSTLASSRQFEELIMSLTAAIHLLTARVESALSPPRPGETPGLSFQAIRKAG
jgi:biopolymer transport protein ExbB/TolQ